MGANQSQSHYNSRSSPSDPSAEQVDPPESTDDLYTILQVSPDASSDEIKKAFRKQALIHHPDKNFDNVEQATKKFAKIQQAYEILSDDDERAFYDRHRDALLHQDNDDDFDPTQLKCNVPRSSLNPGITTKQILKFFDSTLWKGDFSDSAASFFTLYRNLFNQLAIEEKIARHDTKIIYPSFGTSESSYDQDVKGTRALKHFYSTWLNFATQKSFEWVEPHRTNQPVGRRIKRLIEKENQREREIARREYNETVRSLVGFVKKRDPRFASSTACNPEKWRLQEIQRIKRELKEVAEKRAQEREIEAQQFREQAWQRQKDQEENGDLESADDQADSTADDQLEDELSEVAPNDWYCAACGKEFNSQGAWENHERSKKHRQNAQRLRNQMLKEDAELSLSTPVSYAHASQTESPSITPIAEGQKELKSVEVGSSHTNVEDRLEKLTYADESVNGRDPMNSVPSQSDLLKNVGEEDRPKQTCAESENGRESDSTPVFVRMGKSKSKRPTKSVSIISSRTGSETNPNEEDNEIIDDECFKDSSSSNPSKPQSIEISKKDKRRAKEAAKKESLRKAAGSSAHSSPLQALKCNVCEARFDSKNKLFEHIKRFGHASAISQYPSTNDAGPTTTTGKQMPSKPKSKKKNRSARED